MKEEEKEGEESVEKVIWKKGVKNYTVAPNCEIINPAHNTETNLSLNLILQALLSVDQN